jgi:DNA ligase-associated metallophosphoesterase
MSLEPQLVVGGQALVLLPQRAAYVPAHRTLLVADAHLGKAASFRRLGVPVPEGTTVGNLTRLSALLQATGARRLVCLGDLLHSARGRSPGLLAEVAAWREAHAAIEWVLVRGNHDARAGDPPPAWGVHCVDEPWPLGGLALCHLPQVVDGAYALAGHVHPAVRVGKGFESLRLPCFHFGPRQGLLPAFGEFTGSHVVRPKAGDQVFVLAAGKVRALPTLPAS